MVSLLERPELKEIKSSSPYAETVSYLKAEQDLSDTRRRGLLERFTRFRDGMLQGLEQFTSEALESGLRGVRACTVKRCCANVLEAVLTLNHIDLVLIAPGLVLPVQPGGTILTAKILVYTAGHDERRPIVEIAVYQHDDQYQYSMHIFTAEGKTGPLRGGYDVNDVEGRRAAQDLVHHIYSFGASWQERPALSALRAMLGR